MFEKLLQKIARALARNKIRYMVIGGHAVLLYGQPRMTQDIDITLGLDAGDLAKMRAIISDLSLKILVDGVEGFVRKTMVLPVMDQKTGLRVDFIFSTSLYEKKALRRVKKVSIGKTLVNFASLEDVIIHKLVAGRPRDLEDVRGILIKNPKTDSRYVTHWLRLFDQALDRHLTKQWKIFFHRMGLDN